MDVIELVDNYVLKSDYEKGVIGFSEFYKPIRYFSITKTPSPVIIVQAAIHAREYITAYLSLYLAEDFKRRGKRGKIFFIPIVNPDGVKIASDKDPLYKANGRGVDLNVNFDADWGTGDKNVNVTGAENYIGEFPFSESETRALRDFTLLVRPDATVSFHSKGEEIYYGFKENADYKDEKIAKALGDATGYAVKKSINSAGGYKDWCVNSLKIPAFTIEVGSDELSHPLKKDALKDIIEKTRDTLIILTELL